MTSENKFQTFDEEYKNQQQVPITNLDNSDIGVQEYPGENKDDNDVASDSSSDDDIDDDGSEEDAKEDQEDNEDNVLIDNSNKNDDENGDGSNDDEEIIRTLDQLFVKNILVKEVIIPFQNLGNNLFEMLKIKLKRNIEGKCIEEGYVKRNSIKIIENGLSYGVLSKNNIKINVMFECSICKPIDNQIIACKVKNNTIAGIKAEFYNTDNDDNSPIIVFISKEYKFDNKLFLKYKEVDKPINIRVIGSRYELNDNFISIIASIVE